MLFYNSQDGLHTFKYVGVVIGNLTLDYLNDSLGINNTIFIVNNLVFFQKEKVLKSVL